VFSDYTHLENMPFDDGASGVLQNLLPVLESGLVLLRLVPAELDLADGITTANQIVVTNLESTTH
jgi:hypothetical protein